MIFDLDDRLLDLAKKLVFHESPEPEAARRFDSGGTRRSLKPEERKAESNAQQAMSTLREDEKGPKEVTRSKQLIDTPGSPGVDDKVWKKAEASQKSTAAPLPPAMVERFAKALGHDVSDINVHTDGTADEICRAANSEVVARGRDVFFRRGTPLPGTAKGDLLLSNAVEQVAIDSRKADDDQPMRRFVEKEESTKEPEADEPEESGWGLMGLVGAAMAAKQGYDALKSDEPKAEELVPEAPKTDAELAKVAQEGEQQHDKVTHEEATAPRSTETPEAEVNTETKADATELVEREQRLKDVVEAAEQQEAMKERLPESDTTKDQVEGLSLMGATASALLDDVREAKSAKQEQAAPGSEEQEQDSLQQVAAELSLEKPFDVAANYEARYLRPDQQSGKEDIDIKEHRLLMEVDVENAADEFDTNAFGGDLGITVDRVVELVDAHMQDELNDVTGPEREQLRQQIDAVKPQLPEVIERQVREAAESNKSEEQEELELELEEEQATAEAEQTAQDDTFAFGARVDLRTGEVVVTTNDSIPAAIEASATTSAPTTTSGGDGGGAGSGGGGGGDGGGGGGSA